VDGDALDIFIGPHPASPHVFMIDQRDPATDKFDEVKIMAGFDHPAGAVLAYRDSFSDSDHSIPHSPRMGAITAITPDHLKEWLANGDHTKRFSQPGPNETAQSAPAKPAPAAARPANPASTESANLLQFIVQKGGPEGQRRQVRPRTHGRWMLTSISSRCRADIRVSRNW